MMTYLTATEDSHFLPLCIEMNDLISPRPGLHCLVPFPLPNFISELFHGPSSSHISLLFLLRICQSHFHNEIFVLTFSSPHSCMADSFLPSSAQFKLFFHGMSYSDLLNQGPTNSSCLQGQIMKNLVFTGQEAMSSML